MIKIKKIGDSLVNEDSKLKIKKWYTHLYKVIYNFANIWTILCGILPGFISFERIFYTKDTFLFLIFYLIFLVSFFIDLVLFVILSYKFHVFNNKSVSLIISIIYLVILGLLSLNAYLFTDFNLTESGYEVPFNPIMYIIDLLVIFPLYGFYDYFLIKYFYKKL